MIKDYECNIIELKDLTEYLNRLAAEEWIINRITPSFVKYNRYIVFARKRTQYDQR